MTEETFWKERYGTQHGTVHRLEDEIQRLRECLKKIDRDLEDDFSILVNGGKEMIDLSEYIRQVLGND